MPQQGFLRVWKYKSGDLHNIQRHNERDSGTHLSADQLESIDQTLTHLNVIRLKSDKTFLERCEARIAEIDAERAAAGMRRMYHGPLLTLACEFIVSMPDVMDRTPSREDQIAALDDVAAWLTKKYGGKDGRNIISVALHFDEVRMGHPHLHFVFVPVNDKNAVSASSMFTPTSLAMLQRECYAEVFSRYGLRPPDSAYEERNGELVKVRKSRRNLKTKDYRAACEARDAALRERDAAIAERDAVKAEAEDILAEVKAEAKKVAASIVETARTEAANVLKASKSKAHKLMELAEATKAAAEAKARDAEQRVVDAAKLLGLCEENSFAEAVDGLRTAIMSQAAAWDRRMRQALSPERRLKAEQQAAALRTAADEIGKLGG